MIISRADVILGRPAVELRDMLRKVRGYAFTTLGFAERAGLSDEEARSLVEDLTAAGFIERVDRAMPTITGVREVPLRPDELESFTTTIAGNALAKARIGRGMARAKAGQLLQGVIDRAAEVNGDDEWLHWVREVVLYGSMALDGDDPVGDVDVAVVIEPRFDDDDYNQRQARMIEAEQVAPSTITEAITYAQRKVLRHLRGRSPRVDLCETSAREPLPPGAVAITVYKFEPSPRTGNANAPT